MLAHPPRPGLHVVHFPGEVSYTTPPVPLIPKPAVSGSLGSHCVNHLKTCLENGVYDADCCAEPSKAGCISGYSYSKGELCYGTDYYLTCCTQTATPNSTTLAPKSSETHGLSPGLYYSNQKVAVTIGLHTSSQMVKQIEANHDFEVVQVAFDVTDHRVRGRLKDPAGWVSLLNTKTGQKWAHKVKARELYLEQSSLHKTERRHITELAASFLCGLCSLLSVILITRRLWPGGPQPLSARRDRDCTVIADEGAELLGH